MNEEVNYYGSRVAVTKEVAEYLEKSDKELAASDRKYRRHNVPLKYMDPDTTLDTEHCTGRNYLLNVVIRNERIAVTRDAVSNLPKDMQRLFELRYELCQTQQRIADSEHVSKMAICKRLKKLHRLIREDLPNWPARDYIVG